MARKQLIAAGIPLVMLAVAAVVLTVVLVSQGAESDMTDGKAEDEEGFKEGVYASDEPDGPDLAPPGKEGETPADKQRWNGDPEKLVRIKLYSEVNEDNYILIYEDSTVFAVYGGVSYTGTTWTDENCFSYIQLSDGTLLEHGPSGWSCFVWNGETMISEDLLRRQEVRDQLKDDI